MGTFRIVLLDEAARLRQALTELEAEIDPSPEHLLRLRQAGVTVALRDGDLTNALNARHWRSSRSYQVSKIPSCAAAL